MLKEQERLSIRLRMVVDLVLVAGAFVLAYYVRLFIEQPGMRPLRPFESYLWMLFVILPLWWLLLVSRAQYDPRPVSPTRAIWRIFQVNGLGLLLLTLIFFAFRIQRIHRTLIFTFALLSTILLVGARLLMTLRARSLRKRGQGLRHVVVVGMGEELARVLDQVQAHAEAGLNVVAWFSLHPDAVPDRPESSLALGADRFYEFLAENPVDEVIIAVPLEAFDQASKVLAHCEEVGVDTRVAANLYNPSVAKPLVEEFFGIPTIYFSSAPQQVGGLFVKRLIDWVTASVGLVLLAPVFLVVAILIKATSQGPILYRQVRAGLNGRKFTLYKFRTMVHNADRQRAMVQSLNEMTGPVFKARRDPRLTPLGRWLRRWSVDELPQLMNVLRGEMSLVGPRPLPTYEAEKIEGAKRRRFSMKPGLTCLWQVSGRNEIDFDAWMQLDLAYIDHWSLALDAKILLKTVPAVLLGRGAR